MQKLLCCIFLATAVLGGVLAVSAREKPGPKQPGGRAAAPDYAEHWKERLKLDGNQASRFQSAFQEREEAMKPLRADLQETIKKLAEQTFKDKAGDSEIQITLDRLVSIQKSIKSEEEKFKDRIASFLTPVQQATMLLEKLSRGTSGRMQADNGGRKPGEMERMRRPPPDAMRRGMERTMRVPEAGIMEEGR